MGHGLFHLRYILLGCFKCFISVPFYVKLVYICLIVEQGGRYPLMSQVDCLLALFPLHLLVILSIYLGLVDDATAIHGRVSKR